MARIEILTAGHCTNLEVMAHRASPWRPTAFAAAFALIQPQGGGALLFDCGYSRHVTAAMAGFPFQLYRRLLPITLGRDAAAQMAERGVSPATLILSHFHPDHIGGLPDFPLARLVCSRQAWEWVRGRRGFAGLRRGFLADLIPADFTDRVTFAEDLPQDGQGHFRLEAGDETLSLVPLPGHVPGQLGLLVRRDGGPRVLLAADALWRRASLEDAILPHPLAMRVHHDRAAYLATLDRLRAWKQAEPDLEIIPTHDAGA